jgi:ceramide glucosyltransferase
MSLLAWICLAGAAVGTGYQLFQLAAAVRFFRRARRRWGDPEVYTPPVTILKPLKGPGIDLYENLESFCQQDYPSYEIVFGVADPADPAVETVRQLQAAHPERRILLAIGERAGTNAKVANLVNMMPAARHDVFVLSDADIRVKPDYLRTMMKPLRDPAVGLSTCLYRGVGDAGVASLLESLFINTDFIPMVLVGDWLGIRTAYGASIAFTREALDAIGGFEAIRDHLADDYLLGSRIHGAGYEIAVLPYVVETVLDSTTLADVWRHQLRWARTYRACQPVGWFAAIVTHATFWGTASVIATGGAPIGWQALGIAVAIRLGSLLAIMRLLREPETPRHLGLVPVKDLLYSTVWLATWFGRDVLWSGRRFRVEADGRLVPQDAGTASPAAEPERSH